jgi:biopolymer transport protein ExbD
MRIRRIGRHSEEKVELQMTPMIDVVFLLLVFFVMTFRIRVPEGDFHLKMPLEAPTEGVPEMSDLPPLKVRLRAGVEGGLAGIQLNELPLTSFSELHEQVLALVGDARGPGSFADQTEIELDSDYALRFEYTIDAISAVSGYVTPRGEIVRLIEKIKFAPPRGPGGG